MAQADARGDVGEVELASRLLDLHAVFAAAHYALQPQGLATGCIALVRQDEGAAFGAGDVLVGVEAEGDEVAEAADRLAAPACAERLRGILDHAQFLAPREVVQPVAIDRQAREIDRDDGAARGGHGLFGSVEIDIARARIDVDEHRLAAHLEYHVRRRHPGERRGDDFMTFADAGEAQADFQRRGARVEAAHRASATQLGERGLEAFDLRARSDPARAQHLADAGDGRLVDIGTRERQEVHQGFLRIA